MNKTSLYKIIAFTVLLSELIIFFILFGHLQKIIENYDYSGNLYLLLGLATLLTATLFVISILATNRKESNDKYDRDKLIEIKESTKKVDFDNESDQEESLDVEYYLKKILPKVNAKIDLTKFTEKVLSNIAKEFDIVQGLFFVKEKDKDIYTITGKYAYFGDKEPESFNIGQTLSGQVAKNKKILVLEEIPENYVTILSGLGSSSPDHVIIIPIVWEDKTHAIIELASFKEFKSNFIDLFEGMAEQIAQAVLKY